MVSFTGIVETLVNSHALFINDDTSVFPFVLIIKNTAIGEVKIENTVLIGFFEVNIVFFKEITDIFDRFFLSTVAGNRTFFLFFRQHELFEKFRVVDAHFC